MNYIYKTIFFIVGVALLSACEPKMDGFKSSAGSADFSKYVALGNSLTAGYADGALYSSGQSYAYANIIGQQLMLAGGGAFVEPTVGN